MKKNASPTKDLGCHSLYLKWIPHLASSRFHRHRFWFHCLANDTPLPDPEIQTQQAPLFWPLLSMKIATVWYLLAYFLTHTWVITIIDDPLDIAPSYPSEFALTPLPIAHCRSRSCWRAAWFVECFAGRNRHLLGRRDWDATWGWMQCVLCMCIYIYIYIILYYIILYYIM